jgi:hypothetical protein
MGGNNSREAGNKASLTPGFTPLTPLKRPGSIRRLKTDDPPETQPASQRTDEPPAEASELTSQVEQAHILQDAVLSPCPELDESSASVNSDNDPQSDKGSLPLVTHDQILSSSDAKDDSNETAMQSPAVSTKAVYGAAYPPEMAETIMKQFNANNSLSFGSGVLGVSFQIGNLKLTPATANDPSGSNDISKDEVNSTMMTKGVEEMALFRAKAKFEKVLEEETVNLSELQGLCWSGCPPDQRANTWRLLLRYMPANSDRREAKMARLRAEYADAVVKYFDSYDPSSASPYDRTMYNQIAVDLPRTNPSVQLFQNLRVQRCLHRILYVWAIRHPGTGYVQGINDLVTPFFFVFLREQTSASDDDVSAGRIIGEEDEAAQVGRRFVTTEQLELIEADCYHCLTNLLDNAQDNYVLDSRGIQEKVFMLKRIIARLDDKLVAHFERMEVEFLQFAFRWFNCLLMREFSLAVSAASAFAGCLHFVNISCLEAFRTGSSTVVGVLFACLIGSVSDGVSGVPC